MFRPHYVLETKNGRDDYAVSFSVLPFVSGRVLYESRLVAETVTAVLSHTMEVRLMFPVAAVRVMAVLVEPEPQVSLGNGLVLKYAHRVLDTGLSHFRANVP